MNLPERLYRRLVTALDQDAGEITIGDLYQRLIPYRAVRGELGVLELAEYEFALLRLLSGEGGFLLVQEPSIRDEFLRELSSINPILGIYRDYAGAAVRVCEVASESTPSDAEAAPGPKETGAVAQQDEPGLPGRHSARRRSLAPVTPPAQSSPPGGSTRLPDAAESFASAVARVRRCLDCDRTLPHMPDVRFCPYCGSGQGPRECPGCGTAFEGGWVFCVRCGEARAG